MLLLPRTVRVALNVTGWNGLVHGVWVDAMVEGWVPVEGKCEWGPCAPF